MLETTPIYRNVGNLGISNRFQNAEEETVSKEEGSSECPRYLDEDAGRVGAEDGTIITLTRRSFLGYYYVFEVCLDGVSVFRDRIAALPNQFLQT